MWQKLIGVNKVGLKAQSMVTYNVRITVGTPEQELTVIFDTGSFMCAVFSDVSPKGMKELGLLSVRDYIGRSTYTPPAPGGSAFCVCCLTPLVQVHDFDGARAGIRLRFVCGGVGGAGQGQQGREEGHAPGSYRRDVMRLRHGCAQLPPTRINIQLNAARCSTRTCNGHALLAAAPLNASFSLAARRIVETVCK